VYLTDIDECKPGPCKNGATCSNLLNAYSCKCAPGWQGTNCDQGRTLFEHIICSVIFNILPKWRVNIMLYTVLATKNIFVIDLCRCLIKSYVSSGNKKYILRLSCKYFFMTTVEINIRSFTEDKSCVCFFVILYGNEWTQIRERSPHINVFFHRFLLRNTHYVMVI
jgi:hypothetical protein